MIIFHSIDKEVYKKGETFLPTPEETFLPTPERRDGTRFYWATSNC